MDRSDERKTYEAAYGGRENVPFSLRGEAETRTYRRWLAEQVRTGAQMGLFTAPAAPAVDDTRSRIDAEAATLQFAQPLDRHTGSMEDAPLFGGRRQGGLF